MKMGEIYIGIDRIESSKVESGCQSRKSPLHYTTTRIDIRWEKEAMGMSMDKSQGSGLDARLGDGDDVDNSENRQIDEPIMSRSSIPIVKLSRQQPA